MGDTKSVVSTLIKNGKVAFKAEKYGEAIDFYTSAIQFEKKSHRLYSKRSMAYAKTGQYEKALEDADKVIQIEPDWEKGYIRKGRALVSLGRTLEAMVMYYDCVSHVSDPRRIWVAYLGAVVAELLQSLTKSGSILAPLRDKNLMGKLQSDPRTKPLMSQPDYVEMMQKIQSNPLSYPQYLDDHRLKITNDVIYDKDIDKKESGTQPQPPTHCQPKVDNYSPLVEAQRLKVLGNESCMKNEFDVALNFYNQAISINPTDMKLPYNIAVVYLKLKKYNECIDKCLEAVAVGKLYRADPKCIAKSFMTAGYAYKKLGDLELTKNAYKNAMWEDCTPEIEAAIEKVDRLIKLQNKRAHLDQAEELKSLITRPEL